MSVTSWLEAPVPTRSVARRFVDDRKARGETRSQAGARLGVSARDVLAFETSVGSKAARERLAGTVPEGATEPRWRQVARGTVVLLLLVANAFSVVGFLARWTRLRSLTEKAGLVAVVWAAAFFLLRGWDGTGPSGAYDGADGFLFMRLQNAYAAFLLAALPMGWFANVMVAARSWPAAVAGAAGTTLFFWASVVPLHLVNEDLGNRERLMAGLHAEFRQSSWASRQRALTDPSFDANEAERLSALKLLQGSEARIEPWMKDRRAFALHKSIVAACLESVRRGEVEPERCSPKELVVDLPINRMLTFTYLYRTQYRQ